MYIFNDHSSRNIHHSNASSPLLESGRVRGAWLDVPVLMGGGGVSTCINGGMSTCINGGGGACLPVFIAACSSIVVSSLKPVLRIACRRMSSTPHSTIMWLSMLLRIPLTPDTCRQGGCVRWWGGGYLTTRIMIMCTSTLIVCSRL